ncbi:O-antigen ligase family protein [Halalkalicoccus ordinarius]|uniref:O-antigen ligase family protein n=1 Tax=Halalkalicoccus ordinarius TaxID=3116651 RepID=UPI00300F26E0
MALSLLLIFTLPWRGAFQLGAVGTIGRAVGAVVAAVWGVNVLVRGEVRILSRLHLLLGALACWSALSYVWSIAPGLTLGTTLRYVLILGILVVIWDLYRRDVAIEYAFFAYVIGAYVLVGAVFIDLLVDSIGQTSRYTAFDLNPNIIARMLALGTPLAGYLLIRSTDSLLSSRAVRAINLLYFVLSGVAIMLTVARQGMIAYGIALAFLAFLCYQEYLRNADVSLPFDRTVLAAGGVVLLAVLVGAATLILVATNLLTRLLLTPMEVASGDFGGRAPIWEAGMTVFRQRPMLGHGSGTFMPAVEPFFAEGEVPIAAHNAFIQLGVELGLVGIAIYIAILVVAAVAIYRQHTRYRALWVSLFAILFVFILIEGIVANVVKYLVFTFALATAQSERNRKLQLGE